MIKSLSTTLSKLLSDNTNIPVTMITTVRVKSKQTGIDEVTLLKLRAF